MLVVSSTTCIFANTIELQEVELPMQVEGRTKCQIIRDNVKKYCADHGFSESESTVIATAAYDKCREVNPE